MAYEDVRITATVTKRARFALIATTTKLSPSVINTRSSSTVVRSAAALTLRVVTEAI